MLVSPNVDMVGVDITRSTTLDLLGISVEPDLRLTDHVFGRLFNTSLLLIFAGVQLSRPSPNSKNYIGTARSSPTSYDKINRA